MCSEKGSIRWIIWVYHCFNSCSQTIVMTKFSWHTLFSVGHIFLVLKKISIFLSGPYAERIKALLSVEHNTTLLSNFLSFFVAHLSNYCFATKLFFLYIVLWMQNLNNWATQRLIILVVLLSDSGSGFIHNIYRLKICLFVHLSLVVELDTSRRRTVEIVGMALQATKSVTLSMSF